MVHARGGARLSTKLSPLVKQIPTFYLFDQNQTKDHHTSKVITTSALRGFDAN